MVWSVDQGAATDTCFLDFVPARRPRRRASPGGALSNDSQLSVFGRGLNEVAKHVRHRLTFRQALRAVSPAILASVPNARYVDFERAPSGDVYFTNGLIPMQKWDGVRFTARAVGVAPPASALTLSADLTTQGPPADGNIHVPLFVDSSGNVTGQQLDTFWDVTVTGNFSGRRPYNAANKTGFVSGGIDLGPNNNAASSDGQPFYPVSWLLGGVLTGALSGPLAGTVGGSLSAPAGTAKQVLAGVVGNAAITGQVYVLPATPWAYTGTLTATGLSGQVSTQNPPGHATITGTIYAAETFNAGFGASNVGPPVGSFTADVGPGTGVRSLVNDITGEFWAYQRFLDEDGNPSNLSPISNAINVTRACQILYTNVPAPTDPKIVRRQILRNTSGQATTFYVAVDTTDLSSTSFADSFNDEELATQEAVVLFDTNGVSLADRYNLPPDDKPILCAYLDRMFAAGETPYSAGHVEVTNGSATVYGVGTQWTSVFAGRVLYVVGEGRPYQISAVDVTAQALTLSEAYRGATDLFAGYAVRPEPAQRRIVQYTEAGLYEAWPPANALQLDDNGDDVTGLMAAESFLYVLQRRHTWRLSYHLGPEIDGGLFLAAKRGCVNNRSWVYIDGYAYMLDEQGVYKFGGGGDVEHLSAPIQDLFWVERADGGLHINWEAQDWFHALHNKDERTIRWFVALSGSRLPRHALCWNYDSKAWWLEEFAFPVGASAVMDDLVTQPVVAGPSRRVFAEGFGTLDGPDPAAGTTRAAAASGGTESVVGPASATFPGSGVAGSPVAIYDGRGKGQVNIVSAVSGATVRCVRPWLVRPDDTSKFQLGGFTWTWQSGDFRWLNEEGDEQRRVEVVFVPTQTPAQCDLRFYRDFSAAAEQAGYDWPACQAEVDSVKIVNANGDAVIDLTFQYGFAQVRRSGRRELYVWKADIFSLELAGVSAESAVSILECNCEGAV